MFKEFPKYIFHREHKARIVANRAEQNAAGADWAETPVFPEPEAAPAPAPEPVPYLNRPINRGKR
jgi:hypothetical protein